ncbi:MAG TPA: hypothetical protein VEQ36_13445 [Thermomicrobiales bacterium]|nr:hypothetical protein [Thermomicrobiales bacterium]
MIRRAALTWAAMVPVAIVNGTFRELALKPVLGDQTARKASVATASIAFLVLVYLLMREHVVDETDHRLLEVGIAWLAATIAFEFGFGHFVDGKSWGALLHDYNIFAGRLWPVFLGIEVLAPLIVKRFVLWQGAGIEGGQRPQGPQVKGVH